MVEEDVALLCCTRSVLRYTMFSQGQQKSNVSFFNLGLYFLNFFYCVCGMAPDWPQLVFFDFGAGKLILVNFGTSVVWGFLEFHKQTAKADTV